METKIAICTVVIDTNLTFQEFDVFQLHLESVFNCIAADHVKVSALTSSGRKLIRHAWLRDHRDAIDASKRVLEGFFGEQQASSSLNRAPESPTNALIRIAADDLMVVSERYYHPVAIIVTSGRRRIDRTQLRGTLVRLSRRSIPLILFRLAGDATDACCDDDGLHWASIQTPRGRFFRLGIDEIPELHMVFNPGFQEPPLRVQNDQTFIKLLEYEVPRYSNNHVDALLEGRQREGFRVMRTDLSPKRYIKESGETNALLLWSRRLILEYVLRSDVSTKKLKAQFCLRGPPSLLKLMESNVELVNYVRACLEVDLVVSHLSGPGAEAAFQLLLTTQNSHQLARFVKTGCMEALCAIGAAGELLSLFPRSHEWIIPGKLALLTSSWQELERTAARVQDSRKLLLVSPHRMSIAGLFDKTGASISRAEKVLRAREHVLTDEAGQEAITTLGLLWRRRGFFQTSTMEGAALDFVHIPEVDEEPAARLLAVADPDAGVVASVIVQGRPGSLESYLHLLEEDEQVLVRLHTFSDLSCPSELLPFARRSLPLELPEFASLSPEESAQALSATLLDVFTIKVDNDRCHARYVSKDAVVVLHETGAQTRTLYDIRRADLLPQSQAPQSSSSSSALNASAVLGGQQHHLLHATTSTMDDDATHLTQFVSHLRMGYSRCIAATVHAHLELMLKTKDDERLVEDGCELTYIDVDITKLMVMDALPEDFGDQLSKLVLSSCNLVPIDADMGFFRAHDGFARFALRRESVVVTDEAPFNLKNSVKVLQSTLFPAPKLAASNASHSFIATLSSATSRVQQQPHQHQQQQQKEEKKLWIRIYVLIPYALPGAAPVGRSSTLSGASVREGRTIMALEKEIGILISTTILQFARRILSSKQDLAIRLVRETLASVSECVRFDAELPPFVPSTSFEQDEDKLELFGKELAAQTEFPLRLVSAHSSAQAGAMLCHSDDEGWALLTVSLGLVHVDLWSFTDPSGEAASAEIHGCISRVGRRTNQILLLSDLHDTRMASSQLVPVKPKDYAFFGCPTQRHLDIPLGRWVTRKRLLKELAASPVFFVRNRERWFVYRAISNRIAYFTFLSPTAREKDGDDENEDDDDEEGDFPRTFSIVLYAVDPLTPNAVDHLQKILKEMVIELAVESLSAHLHRLRDLMGLGDDPVQEATSIPTSTVR